MTLPGRLDPAQNPWMQTPGLLRIFACIKAGGGTVRMVGGAVRDALIGRAVTDIDLATDLPPEKIAELLKAEGLKVVPTGIEHGTVTAVADHKGYEITTLRRDVETDGRRAKVEFTDNWQADAARRDFTMNALYADADGTLHDYFNGSIDLVARKVRFIGKAEDRIREDVLRILRFFRFQSHFGKGAPDAEGLKACAVLAHLLPQLSTERVWREINKWLAAPDPAPGWKTALENKIIAQLLPDAANIARLEQLIAVEKRVDTQTSSLTRLAALLPQDDSSASDAARKLKMSNREAERLTTLAVLPARLLGKLDPQPFRHALYKYGVENAKEAALLLAACDPGADVEAALTAASDWEQPVFPLQGEDLLKMGLKQGPGIGEILHHIEVWWIDRDFRPTREECLSEARKKAP